MLSRGAARSEAIPGWWNWGWRWIPDCLHFWFAYVCNELERTDAGPFSGVTYQERDCRLIANPQ